MCLESPYTNPETFQWDSLIRAEQWREWPRLVEPPQVPPIEEPPDEELPFVTPDDEAEEDEPDEVELSACPGKHTIDPYDRYCFYCGFDREAAR